MEQRIRVLVLLAALSSVGTAQDLRYFTDGSERTFEVRPPVTEPIESIVWKFNSDLAAEWTDTSPLEIYPKFKTRTDLNTTTGSLVIKHMTKDDTGEYSVEINRQLQGGKYDMKWIRKVNKPEVHLRTLTCSPDSDKCNMTCDGGTEEAKPIDYDWRIGSEEWQNPGKDIEITKADHRDVKDIACRMKNPVSKAESEAIPNPLLPDHSLSAGAIVGIVVLVLALIGGALALGWSFKYKKWPFNDRVSSEPENPPGNPPNSSSEIIPLKPPPSDSTL
ncbi:lymphocyte function-associated antigen 3 [Gasterosteus aculeatus]